MKYVFLGLLLFVGCLYVVALATLTDETPPGMTRVRWATDKNPARDLQTGLFAALHRPTYFDAEQVRDWRGLCRALEGAGLTERLDAASARIARKAAGGAQLDTAERASLLEGLNDLVDLRELHEQVPAGGSALPEAVADILPRMETAYGPEVRIVNRLLLETVLGETVAKSKEVYEDTFVTVESADASKIIVHCATGSGPDVIDVYHIPSMTTYVQAGILQDFTEEAKEMGFSPEATYPALREALMVDGKQYRFPCNVWANVLVYNRDIFDDHGVAYPKEGWTYQDFIETAHKIVNTPSESGEDHLALANWSKDFLFRDMLLGTGGSFFDANGLVSRMDGPEAIAVMQMYHDMIHVHQIVPDAAEADSMGGQGGWGTGPINWFSTGKAAMIMIGRWYIVQVPRYPAVKGKLGSVQLPRWEGRPSRGMVDCRGAAVNITSENKEAAYKFLQFLAGEEYGRMIVRDGDALPPNPALARTGADLVNDVAPDPEFHQPFIDAVEAARPLRMSPFIDSGLMMRWVTERIERVEQSDNAGIDVEAMMLGLADEINRRIRRNLERRPRLRQRFEEVTGEPWTPDWWRTYEPVALPAAH